MNSCRFPLSNHVSSAQAGLTTIRAFSKVSGSDRHRRPDQRHPDRPQHHGPHAHARCRSIRGWRGGSQHLRGLARRWESRDASRWRAVRRRASLGLLNAPLRFVDVTAGQVLLDGRDISHVPRNRVRQGIRVKRQDTFLFSRTLRLNVDVFGKHTDDRILTALRSVHFVPLVREGGYVVAADLDHEIRPRESNISHGQRQLVRLARAVLEDGCRILVVEEAASGIDDATETAIQRSLPGSFQDITVSAAAHRLLTVADFDAILVLKDGKVAEQGAPRQLLAAAGEFCIMVERSASGGADD